MATPPPNEAVKLAILRQQLMDKIKQDEQYKQQTDRQYTVDIQPNPNWTPKKAGGGSMSTDAMRMELASKGKGGSAHSIETTVKLGDRDLPITMDVYDKRAGNKIVHVNPETFDKAFQKSSWQYVGPEGEGGIKDRYKKFGDYVKTAKSATASNANVNKEGVITFGDGRHRYAYMRDQGLNKIPMSMDKQSIEHARRHGYLHEAKGGAVKEPKNTVKAYKLFRVHPDHPGKLFPLFVDANTPVEMNKWTDAKEGDMKDGKVKSKIGALAYRPGWHAGDLPIATHIGEKSDPKLTAPDRRPANHAWAEVEMPDDVDWQAEATKRGTNAQGKVVPVKSHITDQIPKGGHYRYKTNPNMTGNWLIGGSMKVNKVLTDKEVERINKKAGMSDLPRAQPFNKKTFGFAHGGITHAHHLEIEERPL
jgi:hypothetical protein